MWFRTPCYLVIANLHEQTQRWYNLAVPPSVAHGIYQLQRQRRIIQWIEIQRPPPLNSGPYVIVICYIVYHSNLELINKLHSSFHPQYSPGRYLVFLFLSGFSRAFLQITSFTLGDTWSRTWRVSSKICYSYNSTTTHVSEFHADSALLGYNSNSLETVPGRCSLQWQGLSSRTSWSSSWGHWHWSECPHRWLTPTWHRAGRCIAPTCGESE